MYILMIAILSIIIIFLVAEVIILNNKWCEKCLKINDTWNEIANRLLAQCKVLCEQNDQLIEYIDELEKKLKGK